MGYIECIKHFEIEVLDYCLRLHVNVQRELTDLPKLLLQR